MKRATMIYSHSVRRCVYLIALQCRDMSCKHRPSQSTTETALVAEMEFCALQPAPVRRFTRRNPAWMDGTIENET